jgi:hypothetical protein
MLDEIELREMRAREVLAHFCGSGCHGFGETIELCESRGDCVIVVTCPSCRQRFSLDDDEYALLVSWSRGEGHQLACGILPLHA